MSISDTTERPAALTVEWISGDEAYGRILRRAAQAALLQDTRLEICFDEIRGEYRLGVCA
jgi:hypothetical protein